MKLLENVRKEDKIGESANQKIDRKKFPLVETKKMMTYELTPDP